MARWNTRLRQARDKAKLSLAQAVEMLYKLEKVRIHRTFLGQVERGESDLITSKFRALCKLYGADANWVLDLQEILKEKNKRFKIN